MSRVGGIIAPSGVGYLLSAHMPLQPLTILAALPYGNAGRHGLGLLYRRHFDTPSTFSVVERPASQD